MKWPYRTVESGDVADLVEALGELIGGLELLDLNFLLGVSFTPDRSCAPARVLTYLYALQAFAMDDPDDVTVEAYEHWRAQTDVGSPWPTADQICAASEHWGAALADAGVKAAPGRRAQQRRNHRPFTRGELIEAIRSWVDFAGDEDLTFPAYRRWSEREADCANGKEAPLHRDAFLKQFGTWDGAVDTAYPGASAARANRRPRVLYSDDEMLVAVKAAADATSLGLSLTRGAYDRWAAEDTVGTGVEHPGELQHLAAFRGLDKCSIWGACYSRVAKSMSGLNSPESAWRRAVM